MWWYSASAWEHHTCKHVQDNLPIHPDDPSFSEQFGKVDTLPSTSKLASILYPSINIHERAKAAKQFLEEGYNELTSPIQDTQPPRPPQLQNIAQNKVLSSLAKKSRQPSTKMVMSRYS